MYYALDENLAVLFFSSNKQNILKWTHEKQRPPFFISSVSNPEINPLVKKEIIIDEDDLNRMTFESSIALDREFIGDNDYWKDRPDSLQAIELWINDRLDHGMRLSKSNVMAQCTRLKLDYNEVALLVKHERGL